MFILHGKWHVSVKIVNFEAIFHFNNYCSFCSVMLVILIALIFFFFCLDLRWPAPPGHPQCGVDSTRDRSSREGGMDESKSPVKSGKQSQPRGAKALSSEKSNKEIPVQREGTGSAPRRQENLNAAKDEHNIGSRGPGKTFADIPQDKRRGRPSRLTRLTGRTSSGERGKGKVASSQQQLVAQAPDSRVSLSADSSPSANRETSSPAVHGTPEKGLTEQAKSSILAPAKEKSHGDFALCFSWGDYIVSTKCISVKRLCLCCL